jgi:hypothetical protein
MALSMSIQTVYGLEISAAYHRVEALELVTKSAMRFHVRAYVSEGKPFASESVYTAPYDIGGENPIRQAYIHLKSLPQFDGATDC